MQRKRPLFLICFGGILVLTGIAIWLLTPQTVQAQCGSQASSCKTCHEVEGKDPVNNDGKAWHQSHAFGDFCVFCHAGNQQATEKAAAHTGMVPPLSDVKSACQQCHAADLMARAQVYATVLKVDLSGGAATPAATSNAIAPMTSSDKSNAAPTAQPASASAAAAPVAAEIVVNDPNTVDYVQRYNEIVLGQRPVNYGNIALVVLAGLVAVGGGGFVLFNELRIRSARAATKQVEGEYPAEVVDMLPALAKLKYQSREALRNILKRPDKADKVLGVIDTLVSDEKTEE